MAHLPYLWTRGHYIAPVASPVVNASEGNLKEHSSNKRPAPFSVRLSDDERRELVRRAEAAGLSIGGYWKSAVFNLPPPRKSRRPRTDTVELAKLLGSLGRVGSNINQLARILNTNGSVEIPELEKALKDLADMRAAVMHVLGYQETSSDFGQDNDKHDKGGTSF